MWKKKEESGKIKVKSKIQYNTGVWWVIFGVSQQGGKYNFFLGGGYMVFSYLFLVRSYPVHHVGGLQMHLDAAVVVRLSASVRLSHGLNRLSTRAH